MNTACSQCTSNPLTNLNARRLSNIWAATGRALWTRWMTLRKNQRTDSELRAMDGLTTETLKDIGAPEWVLARAQRAQERARQGGSFERDSLHWR